MSDRPRKTTRLTVSLVERDYIALNAIAGNSDVSLSWVIRQAIQRFLAEHTDEHSLPLKLAAKNQTGESDERN